MSHSEDIASMSLMDRNEEEDGSDSGKSRGSSGSSLTLHTSRLLQTSLSPSLLILSFFQTPVLRLMKRMKVSSITLPLSFESQWRGDLTTELLHWGLKKPSQFTEPGMLPAVCHEANCYWSAICPHYSYTGHAVGFVTDSNYLS